MSEVTYRFTTVHATEKWAITPANMVDGDTATYAGTTDNNAVQLLTANECVGADLGAISKVELRAFSYGDADDKLTLRPVFGGTVDGANYQAASGTTPKWQQYWDITNDAGLPLGPVEVFEEHTTPDNTSSSTYEITTQLAQTFTPVTRHQFQKLYIKGYRSSTSPATSLTLYVYAADADHKPTGSALTSGYIHADDMPSSADWFSVSVTPYILEAGIEYVIVTAWTGGGRAFYWRADNTASYSGYAWITIDDGVTWSPLSRDLLFQEEGQSTFVWAWSEIQALDCDVQHTDVSKGNTTYVSRVEILVTYTPSGPPAITGTAAVAAKVPTLAATGTYTPLAITGTADLTSQPTALAAEGTYAPQAITGAGTIVAQTALITAGGWTGAPSFTGTATLVTEAALLAASGTYTPEAISGMASAQAQAALMLAQGTTSLGEAFANGYSYRRKITIDNSKVSGSQNLADFPILFSGTYAYLATTGNGGKVQSGVGYDIRFETLAGTKLDHEIEKWLPTTGEIVAWIRIESLLYDTDTEIYLYYGKAGLAESEENVDGTWSAEYKVVLHLGETEGSSAEDSSGVGNNGTFSGNLPAPLAVQIGNGQDFDGDGDFIQIGNSDSLNCTNQTISFWLKSDTLTGQHRTYWCRRTTTTDGQFIFWLTTSSTINWDHAGSTAPNRWNTGYSPPTDGTKVFLVFTFDGAVKRLYVNDGAALTNNNTTAILNPASVARVGSNTITDGLYLDGALDEFRLLGVARSAGWIITEYNNQNSPSTFYGVGDEEESAPQLITGTGAVAAQLAALSATGTYSPLAITGTSALEGQPAVLAAEGTYTPLAITGTAEITAQASAIAATGQESFSGTAAATAQAPAIAGTGTYTAQPITGTGAVTGQPVAIAGEGVYTPLAITGVGAVEAQAATIAATGSSGLAPTTGVGAVAAQAAAIASTGTLGFTGPASMAAQPPAVAGSGALAFTGVGAIAAHPAAIAGEGAEVFTGATAVDAQSAEIAAAGTLAFMGAGNAVAPPPAIAATGTLAFLGTATVDVQPAAVAGIGTYTPVAITGEAAVAAQPAAVAGTGTYTPLAITGTGAIEAQSAEVSGTGQVLLGVGGPAAIAVQPAQVAAEGTYTPLGITGSASIAAQSANVEAVGTSLLAIVGSGAVAVQTAEIAATGVYTPLGITGEADVSAQPAAIAGEGSYAPQAITGEAAIAAEPAEIAAIGTAGVPSVIGTGAVAASPAEVAATGEYTPQAITGSGAVSAQPGAIAGIGTCAAVGVTGTAAVSAQAPLVGGDGALEFIGAGALVAPQASISATGKITFTGAGAAEAQAALLAGVGTYIPPAITGAGAVMAPAARIGGTGNAPLLIVCVIPGLVLVHQMRPGVGPLTESIASGEALFSMVDDQALCTDMVTEVRSVTESIASAEALFSMVADQGLCTDMATEVRSLIEMLAEIILCPT